MKYNDEILYVQTPKVTIEEVTDKYILVNIDNKFKKFIEDIDNYCIKQTFDNSEKWFKREIPYDALTNMYEDVDTDDSTLRIDFPFIKDNLQCKIYNSDRESIELNTLKEGNSIIILLFFKGLKIYSSNFHLDFHINQIKLIDNEYKILKEYSIIDEEEEIYNSIEDYIFKEDIDIELEKQKQQELEIKKQKELEIKNKMKELEEQLNNLNN